MESHLSRPIRALALACLVFTPVRASGPQTPPVRRGYTIPLLGLADQEQRQIVVDREPGRDLGHPTTALLENGRTILAAYPRGHGNGAIVLKRSIDGGLTWSDRLPVPANWATSQETPTIHRLVDPWGKKRLVLFSGLYPIRMASSEDDGRTWTPLEKIGDFGCIVAMASVERLKDGSYTALFHDDKRFLRGEGKKAKFRVFKTVRTTAAGPVASWRPSPSTLTPTSASRAWSAPSTASRSQCSCGITAASTTPPSSPRATRGSPRRSRGSCRAR